MKKLIISAVAAAVLGLTAFQASAYERWFNLVNDTENAIVAVRNGDPSRQGEHHVIVRHDIAYQNKAVI